METVLNIFRYLYLNACYIFWLNKFCERDMMYKWSEHVSLILSYECIRIGHITTQN